MYNTNGLPFWNEQQIIKRDYLVNVISTNLLYLLQSINPAWSMLRIEAPILTPIDHINPEYDYNDYYAATSELALRPETTIGSYAYLRQILGSHPEKWKRPPVCVWQAGKSFRKEQDQPTKFCRFKEFYQLEFQCLYTDSTSCDYHEKMVTEINDLLASVTHKETRIVKSDRLPSYSEITMDIETKHKGRWMEICSMSRRNDYGDGYKVLEVAIGLDRLLMV